MPQDDGFWLLFGRSLHPALVADDERRYVEANPAASLLLHLTREEILQRRVDDFATPQAVQRIEEDWSKLLAQGQLTGLCRLAVPGCTELEVRFAATANFLRGRHLSILSFPPSPTDTPTLGSGDRLTQRQRQILTLLAMGLDGPRIAEELTISAPTVQTHVRDALQRLGAHTRSQGVALALMSGEIGL